MAMRRVDPAKQLGNLMKEIREDAGVTQRDIAGQLGFAGPTVVSNIEQGIREVRLWEFIEFCKQVGQTPVEVLGKLMKRVPESHLWPQTGIAPSGRPLQNRRKRRK